MQRILDVDCDLDLKTFTTDNPNSKLPEESKKPTSIVLDRADPKFKHEASKGRQLLIKWQSISYGESIATYEYERDLITFGVEYEVSVDTSLCGVYIINI